MQFFFFFLENGSCPEVGGPLDVDRFVLRRKDTVTRFRLFLGCTCKLNDVRVTNCFVFQPQMGSLMVVPALSSRSDEDEDYLFLLTQDTGSLREKRFPDNTNFFSSAAQVGAEKCKRCGAHYTLRSITVPPSTWMLLVEFPEGLRKTHFKDLLSVHETRINGIVFVLAFLLLLEGDHFISLHLHGKDWYFYEDQEEARKVLVRPDRFVMKTRYCVRAIYLRQVEKNPHRCMRRLDEEARGTQS